MVWDVTCPDTFASSHVSRAADIVAIVLQTRLNTQRFRSMGIWIVFIPFIPLLLRPRGCMVWDFCLILGDVWQILLGILDRPSFFSRNFLLLFKEVTASLCLVLFLHRNLCCCCCCCFTLFCFVPPPPYFFIIIITFSSFNY